MRYLRSLLLLSAIGISPPGHGHAQPPGTTVRVHVRAESRIDLEWTENDHVPILQGRLQDDLGRALSKRNLEIVFRTLDDTSVSKRVATDEDGMFWLARPAEVAEEQRLLVDARFEGDDDFEASHVTLDAAELARKPELDVRVADPVDLANAKTEVSLRLEAEGKPVSAPVIVRNELGHQLAFVTVSGEAKISLSTEQLGPPGDGRLIVETKATERWSSRRTEMPIRRRIRPSLSLRLTEGTDSTAKLCGLLEDRFGRLADRIVEVAEQGRRIATLRTDSEGRFCTTLSNNEKRERKFVAAFAGDGRGRWPAHSEVVALSARSTRSLSWLAPLGTIVLGFVSWLFLTGRKNNSGERREGNPRIAGVRPSETERTKADQVAITFQVLALDSGTPLVEADVKFNNASTGQSYQLKSDRDGYVRVERLEKGQWLLSVAHDPGYVAEQAEVLTPHRGQWLDAKVYLRSVRQHADALWTDLASALSGRDVQQLTQREIARGLPELRGAHELAQDIEETTYDKEAKNVEHLESLRKRAAAMHKTGRKSPQVPEK